MEGPVTGHPPIVNRQDGEKQTPREISPVERSLIGEISLGVSLRLVLSWQRPGDGILLPYPPEVQIVRR